MIDKLALTVEEAAELTPLGHNRIRQLCHTDPTFPAFLNGRNIIIPTKALEEWLARQAELRLGFPAIMRRHLADKQKRR